MKVNIRDFGYFDERTDLVGLARDDAAGRYAGGNSYQGTFAGQFLTVLA